MRAPFALLATLALAASCAGSRSDAPAPKLTTADAAPQTGATMTADAKPAATTMADLRRDEGKPIDVVGTFRFPTQKAFARNELELADGTKVVVTPPHDDATKAVLVEANQGARLRVRGTVYIDVIPDKYEIIGRTADPYMVDVTGAALTD